MKKPQRVQLRRAKGWRMPPNTVKVDRSTPLGNPFKVGEDGTAARCVELYTIMLGGLRVLTTKATPKDQDAAVAAVRKRLPHLRGKNLACWCRIGQPCHADVLLGLANGKERAP